MPLITRRSGARGRSHVETERARVQQERAWPVIESPHRQASDTTIGTTFAGIKGRIQL